jgi:hypothetical protein
MPRRPEKIAASSRRARGGVSGRSRRSGAPQAPGLLNDVSPMGTLDPETAPIRRIPDISMTLAPNKAYGVRHGEVH